MQKEAKEFVLGEYSNPAFKYGLAFGDMSCEMIALDLLDQLDAYRVEVWEDGENGAIVENK